VIGDPHHITRRLRSLWPEAAIVAAVLFAFHGVLAGTAHLPYDAEYYHYPLLREVADALSSGNLPAWDSFTYGGSPLLANAQASWLYPPQLLLDGILAVLEKPLTEHTLDVLAVLHLAVAGVATAAVGRRRGLGHAGAAYAGIFVVLTGGTVSQVQHIGLIETLTWIPFSILVVDRLATGITAGRVAALGALFALMVLAGFLPVIPACALLLLGAAVARGQGRRSALLGTAAGVLLGAAMAAVALVPVAELLSSYPPLDLHLSLPTAALVTAILPNAFGHWDASLTAFSGPWNLTNSYFYVGAAAVVLLPLAVGCGRAALREAALVLVLTLASFGAIGERVATFVQGAPVVGRLWRPEDVIYVAAVPLGLLLARALARPPSRRQLGVVAGALLVLAVVAFTGGHGRSLSFFSSAPRRMLLGVVLIAGLMVLAALWRARHESWAIAALTAAALLGGGELATAVPGRYFVINPGPATGAGSSSTGDGSGVVSFLQAHAGATGRIAADTPSLPAVWAGFPPVWHLSDVNGFQPQFSRFQLAFVHALGAVSRASDREFAIIPRLGPYLEQMGTRYVVVGAGRDPFARAPGYVGVFQDGSYRVYRRTGGRGRAYAIDRACLRRRGVSALIVCQTSARVTVDVTGPNSRRLQLPRASRATLIVTGEPWYPGWHAEQAGTSLPVRRLGFLTAVSAPAGVTRVTLDYEPPGLLVGALMSLLAIGGSVLAVARGDRGRRTGWGVTMGLSGRYRGRRRVARLSRRPSR
jgi:hypothetical protein